MKRIAYGMFALFMVIIGINQFVRVTPDDQGIIAFWLSQKLLSSSTTSKIVGQDHTYWSKEEREGVLRHMTLSIESSLSAEELLRKKMAQGEAITIDDTKHLIATLNHAISEAAIVPDKALEKVHPDLPKQFRGKYQAGLVALARGLADRDKEELARGAALYGEFKTWGQMHQSSFRYPPK